MAASTVGCLALSGIVLQAGESKAATCPLANLASCNQQIGDLIFSNFNFGGFAAGANTFTLTNPFPGTSGTVSLNFGPSDLTASTTGSFGYTVSLVNGRTFAVAESNITGSTLGGGSFSTSFTSSGMTAPANASNGFSPSFSSSFGSGLTSQAFTQTFIFTPVNSGNQIDTLSNLGAAIGTTPQGTTSVPGPLPVLGAGAAFGFSRKLRNRIKQAA
ncbi:MAG: hypothetical protein NTY67_15605 [Cyanobacteria bacterium]|nr:hypothetical protein [Cyanobacteriota bacterium]